MVTAARPMQAFLDSSLKVCLCPGTTAHDSGLIVSVEKKQDEVILFFKTDCNDGRKCLNMALEGERICDYLILYIKDNELKEIFCFLELKGGKEHDAVEQVINTYNNLDALFIEKGAGQRLKSTGSLILKACLCFHGTAPRVDEHARNKLKKIFGSNILFKHSINKHFKQFGDFLRQ